MRARLVAFAGAWSGLCLAALHAVNDRLLWHPDLAAGFAGLCGAATFVFAVSPTQRWAFRLGGTFAIGAVGFGVASIVLGTFVGGAIDAGWLSAAAAGLGLMLTTLYWQWWLNDVSVWQRLQERGLSHDADTG